MMVMMIMIVMVTGKISDGMSHITILSYVHGIEIEMKGMGGGGGWVLQQYR